MTSTMDPRTMTSRTLSPGPAAGTPNGLSPATAPTATATTMTPQLQAMFARFEREFDDPEFRGRHEPLVRQFDAPLRDGRRPVDRRCRLVGGMIDLLTAVLPLAVAARAGVTPVLLIAGITCSGSTEIPKPYQTEMIF